MYLKQYGVLLLVLMMNTASAGAESLRECVVLLHGMGRSDWSMSKIEDRLQDAGYLVWNVDYPSTRESVAALSEFAVGEGLQYCEKKQANTIHFVTHSLGGILVRYYLQGREIGQLGRIVMLAPPNKGSEVVDMLSQYDWYAKTLGPAGMALGTGPDSLPNQLGPIPGEIGIITGNFSSDPWFSPIIPGEDDGKVSVESARLDEMSDFLVVDAGHTFIMRDQQVIDQILLFLKNGKFTPPPPSPDSSHLTDR